MELHIKGPADSNHCMKASTFPWSLPNFQNGRSRSRPKLGTIGLTMALSFGLQAERINHEGRILGPMPEVSAPVLFNTPEADAIVGAMQVFPPDNAWNEDITRRPVLVNSAAMISRIASELLSSRRTLRAFYEMNFVLVPDDQPRIPVGFFNYADESDPSPYPIPPNLPIETWPRETGNLTLEEWQVDVNADGGDRHSIIVQPGTGAVWETWLTQRVGEDWQASNGARFELGSNGLRPSGWTSGDAAGLSMLAGLVRYDECERGMVEHAIRIVVKHTRREYLYPATHHASVPSTTDPDVPAMGQRLRLKSSFVIPDSWSKYQCAVLKALKKHGAIVADNGNFFSISVAPDPRFPANAFEHLSGVGVGEFEVVQTANADEGPRSPGAPTIDAGPDMSIGTNQALQLAGSVVAGGPTTIAWEVYDGPGEVHFDDAHRACPTARFSAPGDYRLRLSVDDGLHVVGYDAIIVHVTDIIRIEAIRVGGRIQLDWGGGNGPFAVESATDFSAGSWTHMITTNGTSVSFPVLIGERFFRVLGQP